jgi:hypothetical protein
MAGSVMAPVDATLAEAEPEIDPKKADDSTETLAAPPRRWPAAAVATFMKPCPASPAFSTAPKDDEHRDDGDRDARQAAPDSAFSNGQCAQKALQRQTGMTKLTGNVLAIEPIGERQNGNQRQRPTDRPPSHFQNADQQHNTHDDLELTCDETVLIGERAFVQNDVETCRQSRGAQDQTGPARERGLGCKDQRPRDCQRHMQRTTDEIGNKA